MTKTRTKLGTIARGAICTLAAAAIGSLVLAQDAAAERWRAYSYQPLATHSAIVGLERIAEAMEVATDGRLQIRVNVGGSLPFSTTDITQAVADDVVQFGADGFFTGNIPISGILRLPMLFNSTEEYVRAIEVMDPYIAEALAEQGVTLLAQYFYPVQVIWSSSELRGLDDLSGMKMRVTSPEQAELVQRFGGVPVTIGAPEVAPSLQRGVVEGVFTASAGGGRIWKEMLNYNYRLGTSYFNALIIVNTEAYERLSPEERQVLRDSSQSAAAWITEQMAAEEAQITEELAAGGMVVTEAGEEEVRIAVERMQDFWPQWAAGVGPKAEEALAKVREAIGQ